MGNWEMDVRLLESVDYMINDQLQPVGDLVLVSGRRLGPGLGMPPPHETRQSSLPATVAE